MALKSNVSKSSRMTASTWRPYGDMLPEALTWTAGAPSRDTDSGGTKRELLMTEIGQQSAEQLLSDGTWIVPP